MIPRPCIICGKPRDGDRLWYGSDECFEQVAKMPTDELNAIRMREAIDAWNAPAVAYIRLKGRSD